MILLNCFNLYLLKEFGKTSQNAIKKTEHSNSLNALENKEKFVFHYFVMTTRLAIRYAHVRRPSLRSVSNSTRSNLSWALYQYKKPPLRRFFVLVTVSQRISNYYLLPNITKQLCIHIN